MGEGGGEVAGWGRRNGCRLLGISLNQYIKEIHISIRLPTLKAVTECKHVWWTYV